MSEKEYARPPLRPETRDRLRNMKEGAETFDDVLNRLLDELEMLREHPEINN